MATIKAYTNIEQSRKLADILPLESADMSYLSEESLVPKVNYNGMVFFNSEEEKPSTLIPCWSLAALLDVLPDNYIDVDDTIKRPSLMKTKDSRYMVIYSAFQYTSLYNNPVDACVAMVEKLNKLNLL